MKSPRIVTDPTEAPEHQRADVEDKLDLERAMAEEEAQVDAMVAAWERHGGFPVALANGSGVWLVGLGRTDGRTATP